MLNIEALLRQPEGKTLEFKRDLSSLTPLLKTLVAFANTAGGTLVVGVEDGGKVCGIPDPANQELQLGSAIADSISPALLPELDVVEHEGRSLIIVQVPFWRGPYYFKAEGPEKGVYVRLGSSTRRAGPELLAEMRRALERRAAFDELPCLEAGPDGIDVVAVQRAFRSVDRQIDEASLLSLGILVPHARSLYPSNGGMILFGKERQRLFPDARVSCARFLSTSKAEFIDRLDIEGSILDAVQEVPKFIRRNTRLPAKIEDMTRRDISEYPAVGLREALINALVHADYSLSGMRLFVSIFSDRLEIQNPGMLPFGLTIEDMKRGVSRIRNPVIAKVFAALNLVEGWGSGYKRIQEVCQAGGYPEPFWEELGIATRVVFKPHPAIAEPVPTPAGAPHVAVNVAVNVVVSDVVTEGLNQRQHWLLEQLSQGSKLRRPDLERHWDISYRTAQRDIAELVDRDLIEFVGSPRNGVYQLKRQNP
jgi:ATP-dependent DNA helicase RecG